MSDLSDPRLVKRARVLASRIEEPQGDAFLRRRVNLGFAGAVLLTMLLGFLSLYNARKAAEDEARVARAHEVSASLELALRQLDDVETGARGFALTREESFLGPYETGKSAVSWDLQTLSVLVSDNPDQVRLSALLTEQANARIEASNEIVAARQKTGSLPTFAQLEHGKKLMDAVRATVAQMEAKEQLLLDLRSQRTHSTQQLALSVIALGSICGVALLSIAGFTVSREIGISARARAQVNALNAELEQRVAERTAALSESAGRLSNVIQAAMDAIITTDDQQRILVFNAAAEKMFRCPAAEALGQAITRFIPQRFRAAHEGHIRKFAESGATARAMGALGELWGVRADGGEFHLEASVSQVVTGGKKLFTVILRDITERVQAEAMREYLAAVVDYSDDAIISKDLNGIIKAWNRGAEKVFGYSAAEAVGKPMLMLFPKGREKEEADILARLRRGESVEHFETVRVRKNGEIIDVSVTISPIRDGKGAIVGASKIARDITERKRVEQALSESHARLQQKEHLLSESQRIAHIGSWICDPADPSGAIKWSDELYRICGLSPETFTPTVESFLCLLVPEDRPAMQKWIAACATGENAGDLEFRVTLPDGSIRVLMGRGELQRDSENNPTLMTGTSQDITDRKRVEGTLRESEERFQAMANGIPQLAWMAEADGRIFWYNRRWYEYTGTTFEEMEGWAWQTVHDAEVLPKVLEKWRRAIATGQPFDMEFPLRGADGVFRAFITRVMPLKNSEDRVIRWFGTNTDISERKEAEERLARQAQELSRRTEELLRSQSALENKTRMLNLVLESMSEGLVAADREGRFLLWNSSASKLLSRGSTGLPPEQWSSHYACYQPDGITPCPMDHLPLVRAMQGESLQKELIIRHEGSEDSAILEFSGRPMKDAQGNLCGGVVAFHDITQRKKDEREIRKLNEELEMKVLQRTAQLEATNHELEAFTYSVSHDLRAPLRHISSFSKILHEDFGAAMDAEARRLLERIENGARRMTLLVDGLLSLARFGRQALQIDHTELNPIVDGVVSVLQTEYAGRAVEWHIAPLPVLECDPLLIRQVFQNLLANALKYTGRRTKAVIEIDSIQQPGKPAVIFVRDNGAGFSMQYADKLFGVFQRMHKDSEFEGTGVGLATVHRIIQKHGGSIWAEAEVDRGATFYFTVGEKASIETIQKATTNRKIEHAHDGRS